MLYSANGLPHELCPNSGTLCLKLDSSSMMSLSIVDNFMISDNSLFATHWCQILVIVNALPFYIFYSHIGWNKNGQTSWQLWWGSRARDRDHSILAQRVKVRLCRHHCPSSPSFADGFGTVCNIIDRQWIGVREWVHYIIQCKWREHSTTEWRP